MAEEFPSKSLDQLRSDVLSEATQIMARLDKGIDKLSGPSNRVQASQHLAKLEQLSGLLAQARPEMNAEAFGRLLTDMKEAGLDLEKAGLLKNKTPHQATSFLTHVLGEHITKERDTINGILDKIKIHSEARAAENRTALEEMEHSGGIIKRTFQKILERHDDWISKKSDMGRMTIGNAEVFLGSVLALHGLSWTINSIRGKQLAQKQGENGTEFYIEPMPPARRASGAAAGVAAMVAGGTVAVLGFSALRH